MDDGRKKAFRFGKFFLDDQERVLLRDGRPVALTQKAFDLLVVLVRNSGHLVTKDDLLDEVWPDAVVAEVNLSVNISALRKVLAKEGGTDKYIETVPKRGYRFIEPVELVASESLDIVLRHRMSARISVVDEFQESAETQPTKQNPQQEVPNRSLISRIVARKQVIATVAFILVVGIGVFWYARSGAVNGKIDSIAVLPFSTDDPINAYLADGLSESTMNGLAKLTNLRVAPRTSVLRYKSQSVNPPQVGQELGVQAVVIGRVSHKNELLTIQLDLIDARRNSEISAFRYTGGPSDLISLQTRMTQDLSRALNVTATGEEQQLLAHHVTENSDAYRAYLEGRYFWNQKSETGLKKAIEGFQRATQIDPNFALAYSGLADSFTTLGYFSYISPTQAFPVAKNYALKAIELDPALAEPHASLGYDKFYFDWDWAGAENEFRRAIELNANYATAHQWYSIYLLSAGRPNEAFQEIFKARQYDPLSLSINTDIGFHHYYNKQYEEAIKQLTTALEMKKDFPLAHLWLGRSYQQLGRYDEALAEFRQVEGAFNGWPVSIAALGYVDGVSGRRSEASKELSKLESLSKQRYVTAYGVALVYAGMGQTDETFEWLNKAFDERSHWLVWLRLDPRWDNVRSDPRFGELIERMHFPS